MAFRSVSCLRTCGAWPSGSAELAAHPLHHVWGLAPVGWDCWGVWALLCMSFISWDQQRMSFSW